MPKRKCLGCKERFDKEKMIILPVGAFHSMDCALQYQRDKRHKAAEKAFRAETKVMRDRVKTSKDWYAQLQTLVNQFVVHVRDKGRPCATCGTENPNIKYDAGHWQTRGARPEIRFNLYNINKQCSQKCNVYASGAKQEHEEYISNKYGAHIAAWLKSHHHPSLKEQFPHFDDIKAEMARYRKILRDNGIRPNA